MSESTRRRKRLYVVLASDTVRSAEIPMYTENVRTEVLRIANPRKTKHLPASCLLFHGMRLLLFSKKCARLGLMSGCACVLEDILMHDREVLPNHSEVGEVIPLQFMPTALLLRAEDAKWTLPPEQLPPLPESMSRRGLFLLRPHTAYFTYEKLHIKRVQFPVFDASVRIVYGAQGEYFKAVVADLKRPHDMSEDLFWLACYVMISRAQSLDGLLFTRLCARTALEKGAPKYFLDEVNRLLEIEKISKDRLKAYLQKQCRDLPTDILNLFSAGETMSHGPEEEVPHAPEDGAQENVPAHVRLQKKTRPTHVTKTSPTPT